MALDLYEHNANAYMAAYEMMDKYGKAAIVHPTGTGKSYIAFKLIEAHPNEMIIWLSPASTSSRPSGRAYCAKTRTSHFKMYDFIRMPS